VFWRLGGHDDHGESRGDQACPVDFVECGGPVLVLEVILERVCFGSEYNQKMLD
jgi:hypothetical protein